MAGMPYPPNLCASVPICGRISSARMFCVFCVFCGNSLPVCFVWERGSILPRNSRNVRLRYWRRGYGRMPYPPNLCVSVPICGRLSLPEGSVCSACSVGHSPHLLCWCCRGSCASVVVFSHGFHGFPQMVRLCYWRRGYGILPYPPNQCASVSICGRHFSARRFCVFRVFCGTLSPRLLCWCTSCSGKRQSRAETSAPPKSSPKSYLREPKPPLLDEPDGLNVERGADEPDELSRHEPKLLPEKPLLPSG